MANKILSVALVGVLAIAGAAGYRLAVSHVATDVYRDRLSALGKQYDTLRDDYNQAVRKTAVTELLIEDGQLNVIVRSRDGVLETLETPFDPASEIYVDYAVIDGRLWIRRVFNDNTPPREGVTVDPDMVNVNWESVSAAHGKAVYRSLGEGRWRITVTGDGSLGLAKASDSGTAPALERAPQLREFEPVEETVDRRLEEIGWRELAQQLIGWNETDEAASHANN
jgi:hypothetical protein